VDTTAAIEASDDPASYQYKNTLQDQLLATLQHVIAVTGTDDVAALRELFTEHAATLCATLQFNYELSKVGAVAYLARLILCPALATPRRAAACPIPARESRAAVGAAGPARHRGTEPRRGLASVVNITINCTLHVLDCHSSAGLR
jgi:hypothetical protein